MNTLNLKRQDHLEPDCTGLNDMLNNLRDVLRSRDMDSPKWQNDVAEILQFQDADGSFKLLDSFRIESDVRVEYCYMPTYICSAILMKALLCDRNKSGASVEEALSKALKMCCGRSLAGHGYDSFRGTVDALKVFMEAGLREFLLIYPDLCRDFTDMIGMISAGFLKRESEGNFTADWLTDFTKEIRAVNDYFLTYNVFVYGTLLQGEANHEYYLKDSSFLGTATIEGFEMYDIGSFPGIIKGDGMVKGELYEIPAESLEDLDCLEGEGSLYIRQCVPARTEKNEVMPALVYVYHRSVTELSRIPEAWQPYTANWKERRNDYVWYVSYGSNMLKERFMHYIKGGQYAGGGASHEACRDTSDPIAVTACDIPYDMYFRNRSGSWGGKGVSFLDVSKPGHALGVAYLITKEQFRHVSCQENGGCPPEHSSWYNTVVSIGAMDGCDVVTITNDNVGNYNDPADRYLETLHKGIAENYPEMTGDEIDRYLEGCIR